MQRTCEAGRRRRRADRVRVRRLGQLGETEQLSHVHVEYQRRNEAVCGDLRYRSEERMVRGGARDGGAERWKRDAPLEEPVIVRLPCDETLLDRHLDAPVREGGGVSAWPCRRG